MADYIRGHLMSFKSNVVTSFIHKLFHVEMKIINIKNYPYLKTFEWVEKASIIPKRKSN